MGSACKSPAAGLYRLWQSSRKLKQNQSNHGGGASPSKRMQCVAKACKAELMRMRKYSLSGGAVWGKGNDLQNAVAAMMSKDAQMQAMRCRPGRRARKGRRSLARRVRARPCKTTQVRANRNIGQM